MDLERLSTWCKVDKALEKGNQTAVIGNLDPDFSKVGEKREGRKDAVQIDTDSRRMDPRSMYSLDECRADRVLVENLLVKGKRVELCPAACVPNFSLV